MVLEQVLEINDIENQGDIKQKHVTSIGIKYAIQDKIFPEVITNISHC